MDFSRVYKNKDCYDLAIKLVDEASIKKRALFVGDHGEIRIASLWDRVKETLRGFFSYFGVINHIDKVWIKTSLEKLRQFAESQGWMATARHVAEVAQPLILAPESPHHAVIETPIVVMPAEAEPILEAQKRPPQFPTSPLLPKPSAVPPVLFIEEKKTQMPPQRGMSRIIKAIVLLFPLVYMAMRNHREVSPPKDREPPRPIQMCPLRPSLTPLPCLPAPSPFKIEIIPFVLPKPAVEVPLLFLPAPKQKETSTRTLSGKEVIAPIANMSDQNRTHAELDGSFHPLPTSSEPEPIVAEKTSLNYSEIEAQRRQPFHQFSPTLSAMPLVEPLNATSWRAGIYSASWNPEVQTVNVVYHNVTTAMGSLGEVLGWGASALRERINAWWNEPRESPVEPMNDVIISEKAVATLDSPPFFEGLFYKDLYREIDEMLKEGIFSEDFSQYSTQLKERRFTSFFGEVDSAGNRVKGVERDQEGNIFEGLFKIGLPWKGTLRGTRYGQSFVEQGIFSDCGLLEKGVSFLDGVSWQKGIFDKTRHEVLVGLHVSFNGLAAFEQDRRLISWKIERVNFEESRHYFESHHP